MGSVAITLALLAALVLPGCAAILPGRSDPPPAARPEPAPPARSEDARPDRSPASGPAAPVAPAPSRPAEPPRLAEEIARMTAEFAELQNALARLVASSQRQEEQLRSLERRVGELAVPAGPEAAIPRGFAPSQVSPAPPSVPSSSAQSAQDLYDGGMAKMREGQLDAAHIIFQDLIANHPTHPLRESAQLMAGDILYRQDNPRGALVELEGLLEAVPKGRRTPETLLKIGLCYRKIGNEGGARRTWERLTREYPNTAQAREARTLLRRARAR